MNDTTCTFSRSNSADLFKVIAEGLGKSAYLTEVDLYCPVSTPALAKAISENNTVKKLKLACCGIGDAGATELADGIKKNTSLTELDLTNTGIKADGSVAIVNAVNQQGIIHTLSLRSNQIAAEHIREMIAILKGNKTLKCLDFNYVGMSSESIPALVDLIMRNSALTEIGLTGCSIDLEGKKAIQQALKFCGVKERTVDVSRVFPGDSSSSFFGLGKLTPSTSLEAASPAQRFGVVAYL